MLNVSNHSAVVIAQKDKGAFYGFQSLRQLLHKNGDDIILPLVDIKDKPVMPLRGIRLYLPGPENIAFFKRFVRDFMVLYKFNMVILEVNGIMRLDKHPEINVGTIEFANAMNYSRRGRPEGPGNQFQNSAHHDAGDGRILEKAQVADLVSYLRQFHINVIPEIPSLTHAYYLLNRHRELAEIQAAEGPDTYCPSNPESYQLLFDVYDEYIEVIQPDIIHIGKDEWRMPMDVCPKCAGKDYRDLFVHDVNMIYDYLHDKGIRVAMWGDHLLESVRDKEFRQRETKTGYTYKIPGALTPQQVLTSIPKDILIFNWFWGDPKNDKAVEEFGFEQVYGNLRPNISEWEERCSQPSIKGGAPSSWAATTELNIGKDLLYDFLGCANLLWSDHHVDHVILAKNVRMMMTGIREQLSGIVLPSRTEPNISSIDISDYANVPAGKNILGIILNHQTNKGGRFSLVDPDINNNMTAIGVSTDTESVGLPSVVSDIKVNRDVSSLIFLHACAVEAGNEKAYRKIYNFDDTSDLLGWYEITYEDGFVETIPIRYGINILDVSTLRRDTDTWEEGKTGAPQNVYSYRADPLELSLDDSSSLCFFVYEWLNPRFGKIIKSISLNASRSYINAFDEKIPANAILLSAINYADKRPIPDVSYKK